MLPLHDDNPTHRLAILTIAIILLNVAIYAFQASKPDPESFTRAEFRGTQSELVCQFGVMPDRLVDGQVDGDAFAELCADANASQPRATTLITHQFMHGSWLHLAGNMLFL